MNITVKYSCHGCALDKVDVSVPARGPESVIAWLQETAHFVAADHRRRSPLCPATECDLMIPQAAHNNARVGEVKGH